MDIHYPDGGCGWVVAINAAVIVGLITSVHKCSGQVYVSMLQDTNYTRSQLGTVLVLPRVLGSLLGIFTNKLAEMYSFKVTLFIGTFLLGLGMCLSSLVTHNISVFTLTFGVLIGIGTGFSLTPCTIVTGLYFKKNRSLAMGFMTSLAGTNSFIMPNILQLLLDTFHLKGALLLWSGILFQGCVAAMFIRQPTLALQSQKQNSLTNTRDTYIEKNDLHSGQNGESSEHNEDKPPNCCTAVYKCIKLVFTQLIQDCKNFKNFTFILLLCNRVAYFYISTCVFLIIPPFALEQIEGITASQAALLISIMSIGDVGCRWIGGWINNCFPNLKRTFYLISILGMAITAFSLQFTHTYTSIVVVCLIYGLFNGYAFVSYFLVMFDTFGPAQTPGANAIHHAITGIYLLSTGPTVGQIRDLSGSYKHCFTLVACFGILTVLLWLGRPLMANYKKLRSHKIQITE